MDFEDNNPFSVSDEEMPRPRIRPSSSGGGAISGQRIVINEAGKSREGSGRGHITYTIRLGPGVSVRRRYSDFESLRKLLRRLFPCVVVPPIPEKHTISAYAASPAHAHEDSRVIEHRQRTLANFLNRCIAIPAIHDSWVLERFLDPNTSWKEVLQSDRVAKLPLSPLQAPPIDPASASSAHAYLPIPSAKSTPQPAVNLKGEIKPKKKAPLSSPKPAVNPYSAAASLNAPSSAESGNESDSDDSASLVERESKAKEYEHIIGNGLEKRAHKINRHYAQLASQYADLGGQFNSFSLDSHGQFERFAPAVEKFGQAADQGYISTNQLVDELGVQFTEPLAESVQLAVTARQVLRYRRQRELQVHMIKDALAKQEAQLTELLRAESEAERMNSYLHADDRISNATKGLGANSRPKALESGKSDGDDMDGGRVSSSSSNVGINARANISDSNGNLLIDGSEFASHWDNSEEISNIEGIGSDHEGDQYSGEDSNSLLSPVVSRGSQISGNATPPHTSLPHSSASESSITFTPAKQTSAPTKTSTTPAAKTVVATSGIRRGFKLPGLGHINHAIHGIMDVDPQTTRRNNITRSRERIDQLKAALEVAMVDAEVATTEVTAEIDRFNTAKYEDIHALVKSFVRCHIEWAEKNLESWTEARQAIIDS